MDGNRSAMSWDADAATGEQVQPAKGRPACRVALDRRVPGCIGAVAVDTNNDVCAWLLGAMAPGETVDIPALLKQLAVKPRELRILVGSDTARIAVTTGAAPPDDTRVREALLHEGYPLDKGDLSHSSVRAGPDTWLVAACAEAFLAPTVEAVPADLVSMPTLVVDQLLFARQLALRSAAIETGPAGFSFVALPDDAPPVSRYLAATEVADATAEARWALSYSRISAENLAIRGEWRDELADALAADGQRPATEALPQIGAHRMPAALEVAWCLAVAEDPPTIESMSLENRRRSLRQVRGVAIAGGALTLLGLALFVAGLLSVRSESARIRALGAGTPEFTARLQNVREVAELRIAVGELQGQMEGRDLPWPPLADSILALALSRAERAGWERLTVSDGVLELDVSVSGPAQLRDLEGTREALERTRGLLNVAWDAPMIDTRGLGAQQSFRATIRDPAAAGEPSSR